MAYSILFYSILFIDHSNELSLFKVTILHKFLSTILLVLSPYLHEGKVAHASNKQINITAAALVSAE